MRFKDQSFFKRSLNQKNNEASCFESHIFVEENLNWIEIICLLGKLLIGKGIICYGYRVKLLCSSVWVMKVTGRPDSRISSHPDWDTNEDNKSFRFYVLVVNPNLVLLYSCRMKKLYPTEHCAALFSLHSAHLPGNPWLVFSPRVSRALSRFSFKSCRSFR